MISMSVEMEQDDERQREGVTATRHDGLDKALAQGSRARRFVGLALVVTIAALGWLYIAGSVAVMLPERDLGALGPGMALLNVLSGAGFDEVTRALLASLCAVPGASHLGMPAAGPWTLGDLGAAIIMWAAMAGGMMLPTAAPLVTTYAEIADREAQAGKRAASVILVILGYLAVWLVFSAVAGLAQWAMTRALVMNERMTAASPVFAGALFLMAGAYQFSPLKHACLAQCRSPFPTLFGQWSERAGEALRLGCAEGLACLGCCWAMMALMFAVGTMNIVWMVGLAIVMMLEKLTSGRTLSFAVGVVLVVAGLAEWGSVLIDKGIVRLVAS